MHRRDVLVLVGAALATGCLDVSDPAATDDGMDPTGEGATTPTGHCEEADRPEPDPPGEDADEAVEPAAYPDPPDSLADADVRAYVKEFERAYRRNELVERWGKRLVGFGMGSTGVSTEAVDDGVEALVEYVYWEEVEEKHGDGIVHGDSPILRVAYYVDGTGAWRAEDEAPADTETVPDPRAEGDRVACF